MKRALLKHLLSTIFLISFQTCHADKLQTFPSSQQTLKERSQTQVPFSPHVTTLPNYSSWSCLFCRGKSWTKHPAHPSTMTLFSGIVSAQTGSSSQNSAEKIKMLLSCESSFVQELYLPVFITIFFFYRKRLFLSQITRNNQINYLRLPD